MQKDRQIIRQVNIQIDRKMQKDKQKDKSIHKETKREKKWRCGIMLHHRMGLCTTMKKIKTVCLFYGLGITTDFFLRLLQVNLSFQKFVCVAGIRKGIQLKMPLLFLMTSIEKSIVYLYIKVSIYQNDDCPFKIKVSPRNLQRMIKIGHVGARRHNRIIVLIKGIIKRIEEGQVGRKRKLKYRE